MSKRANKVFKLLKIFLIEIQDYSVDEINDKVDSYILDELIDKITTIKEKYNDESYYCNICSTKTVFLKCMLHYSWLM